MVGNVAEDLETCDRRLEYHARQLKRAQDDGEAERVVYHLDRIDKLLDVRPRIAEAAC